MERLIMSKEILTFPLLCFSQGTASIIANESELTNCNTGALKNGYFKNMLLIRSDGVALRVKDVATVGGRGLFFGYRLIGYRRIRVKLSFDREQSIFSCEEVRHKVFEAFRKWHGWSARGDVDELREKASRVQTIRELMEVLRE